MLAERDKGRLMNASRDSSASAPVRATDIRLIAATDPYPLPSCHRDQISEASTTLAGVISMTATVDSRSA